MVNSHKPYFHNISFINYYALVCTAVNKSVAYFVVSCSCIFESMVLAVMYRLALYRMTYLNPSTNRIHCYI